MNSDRNLGFAELITETDSFIRHNFFTTIAPGLVAGVCRYIQEGGIGEVSVSTQASLGMVVFLARAIIVFSVAGDGNILDGVAEIFKIFSMNSSDWKNTGMNLKGNFRYNLIALFVNIFIFIMISLLINIGLSFLMEYTPFLTYLKEHHIMAPSASHWPVLLFLKNISIIPFAFVFEILLIMFLAGATKLRFL
jgi:hypothetical protein